jgi:hypothetical protein
LLEGKLGYGVSRIRQDRNEEEEPCACGFTRRPELNRDLERPVRGESAEEENVF